MLNETNQAQKDKLSHNPTCAHILKSQAHKSWEQNCAYQAKSVNWPNILAGKRNQLKRAVTQYDYYSK